MEDVRTIVQQELIHLFEASNKKKISKIRQKVLDDPNDCVPENEISPYKMLKKRLYQYEELYNEEAYLLSDVREIATDEELSSGEKIEIIKDWVKLKYHF